ncbi:hypothetical protein [Streptomyces sp. NPDC091273]|nr:hypothetical protein [Streptomyces sp. DSM 41633]
MPDFAQRLADLGKEVHLRFVLVPGLTDVRAPVDRIRPNDECRITG